MPESSKVFTRCKGAKIYYVERHQGIYADFSYTDANSGQEFDVCKLPEDLLAEDKQDVMLGDRDAHRRVIRRAIAAGHDFRNMKGAA